MIDVCVCMLACLKRGVISWIVVEYNVYGLAYSCLETFPSPAEFCGVITDRRVVTMATVRSLLMNAGWRLNC